MPGRCESWEESEGEEGWDRRGDADRRDQTGLCPYDRRTPRDKGDKEAASSPPS